MIYKPGKTGRSVLVTNYAGSAMVNALLYVEEFNLNVFILRAKAIGVQVYVRREIFPTKIAFDFSWYQTRIVIPYGSNGAVLKTLARRKWCISKFVKFRLLTTKRYYLFSSNLTTFDVLQLFKVVIKSR